MLGNVDACIILSQRQNQQPKTPKLPYIRVYIATNWWNRSHTYRVSQESLVKFTTTWILKFPAGKIVVAPDLLSNSRCQKTMWKRSASVLTISCEWYVENDNYWALSFCGITGSHRWYVRDKFQDILYIFLRIKGERKRVMRLTYHNEDQKIFATFLFLPLLFLITSFRLKHQSSTKLFDEYIRDNQKRANQLVVSNRRTFIFVDGDSPKFKNDEQAIWKCQIHECFSLFFFFLIQKLHAVWQNIWIHETLRNIYGRSIKSFSLVT